MNRISSRLEKAAGWAVLTLFALSVYWMLTGSASSTSRHTDPFNGCRSFVCEQIDAGNGP